MKTTFALTLMAASALVCVVGKSDAAGAPRLSLADLPEAGLPAVPALAMRPKSIPSTATIEQLHIEGRALGGAPGARRNVVQGLAGLARGEGSIQAQSDTTTPAEIALTASTPDACVSVTANGRDSFRTTQLSIARAEGVMPIRIETLKESADGAVLDVLDAWVDPATQGATEIQHKTIALKRAATGPLGAAVYGFRQGASVNLLIPSGMNAQLIDADGRAVVTSCQVARGELKTERGKGSTLSGFFTKMTSPTPEKDGFAATTAMPIRISVTASVSQLSADPDPLLSVQLHALDEIPKPQRLAAQAANAPPAPIFD